MIKVIWNGNSNFAFLSQFNIDVEKFYKNYIPEHQVYRKPIYEIHTRMQNTTTNFNCCISVCNQKLVSIWSLGSGLVPIQLLLSFTAQTIQPHFQKISIQTTTRVCNLNHCRGSTCPIMHNYYVFQWSVKGNNIAAMFKHWKNKQNDPKIIHTHNLKHKNKDLEVERVKLITNLGAEMTWPKLDLCFIYSHSFIGIWPI